MSKKGPRIGDMWDFFQEQEGAPLSFPHTPGKAFPPVPPYSGRPAQPAPDWTKKPGFFEWGEERPVSDPKVDRFVKSLVRENPAYLQDILTGMYGLAGSNAALQKKVLDARESALIVAEYYPPRKDASGVAQTMSSYMPSPDNFYAFKQALLQEFPVLIQKEIKNKKNAEAEVLIMLADKVFAL